MKINICRTVYDQETSELIEVREVLQMIKSSKELKGIQDTYRKQTFSNKAEKQTYKAGHFKAATFNGSFELETKITNDTLKHGSGLAIMDLDDVTEKGYNLKEFKQKIFNEKPFVVAVFISPSNNGLKVLVKIPVVNSKKLFRPIVMALMNEFPSELVDGACKDVRRMTYLAYDPDLLVRNYDKAQLFKERHFEPAYTPKYDVFEDFKQHGPSIENMLIEHSWQIGKQNGDKLHVYRPGKEGQGPPSGSIINDEILYLFTDATDIDPEKAHDKVSVFAALYANNDNKAARELMIDRGHGKEVITKPGTNGQDNFKNNGQDKPPFTQGIDLEEQFKKDLERFKKDNDELRNNVVSGPIEMTPLVMHMDGNTAVFDGNLCGIQGSYGTGKSRMAQAICTLVFANDKDLVLSGLKINPMLAQRPVVIMIDTERSKKDRLPIAIRKVIENAGYDPEEIPEGLEYFTIRGVSRLSRRRMVEHILSEMAEKYKHRKMFLSLDIVTDMVKTFMDEIDSMALTDSINNMFDDYDCSGVVVIHTNRGGEESLGHLGAELDRKVTTKIHLHQDPKTGFLEVSMGKNNEGEKPAKYVLSFDTKTDLYQFDASASLSIGVDIGVKNNVHKYIKIDETVKESELAERLAEEEDIDLSVETIKKHLKRMADQMTPVCDPFGEPIGYFLREKKQDGKARSAYTTLIKHEKPTK